MHTEDKISHVGIDPVCVNWEMLEKNPDLNPKEIPEGRCVFFIRKSQNCYFVDFGLVYAHYHDGIAIQRVEFPDRRMVKSVFTPEPVPFKEFPHRTDYAKLPKGWSWNTPLFEIVFREPTEAEKSFSLNLYDPDAPSRIAEAYQQGILVNVRDNESAKIKSVIEKQGYYLAKEHYDYIGGNYSPDTVMLSPAQVFTTYESALENCKKYEEELTEQADMTDLEWAEKTIREDVERWAGLYHIQDGDRQRVLDFLLGHKDLENLETKLDRGHLVWRIYGKTRWNAIPVN